MRWKAPDDRDGEILSNFRFAGLGGVRIPHVIRSLQLECEIVDLFHIKECVICHE